MEQVWSPCVLIEIVITDYLPGVDCTARNSSPPPFEYARDLTLPLSLVLGRRRISSF